VLAKQVADGTASPDTLSDEELSYAASMTPSLQEREAIYKAATKKNDSYASHNNLGAVYLQMAREATDENQKNTYIEQAITQFEISLNKQESSEVYNNLAVAYMMQGNREKAVEANRKSLDLGPDAENAPGTSGVSGSLQLQGGLYSDAITSLSESDENVENLFNRGLAQLLSNDYQNALTTFEEVVEMESNFALGHYGAAIAAARLQNEEALYDHLGEAVSINPELKEDAMNDLEFRNYRDSEEFRNTLK